MKLPKLDGICHVVQKNGKLCGCRANGSRRVQIGDASVLVEYCERHRLFHWRKPLKSTKDVSK